MKERLLRACVAGILAVLITIFVICFGIAIFSLIFTFPKLFIGILVLFIIWTTIFFVLC